MTEERRVRVAALYLKGSTMAQIAVTIGVGRATVSRDLKVVNQRWQAAAVADIDRLKAKELAKLDVLEATLWEGWERSKGVLTKTMEESNPNGIVTREVKEERDGNPAFLDGVLKCISKRCEILGLYAPDLKSPPVDAVVFKVVYDQPAGLPDPTSESSS